MKNCKLKKIKKAKKYNTAEDIDRLVEEYISSGKYSEEILNAFSSFINKYFRLLMHGKPSYSTDIVHFVNLLLPNPSYSFESKVNIIHENCKSYFAPIDLMTDLKIIFLQTVKKYKKKPNVHFTGYIYNLYKYRLSNYLAEVFKKDIHSNKFTELKYDEPVNISEILDFVDHFSTINSQERHLLELKYIQKLTFAKIAKKMFLNEQEVKKIIKEAKKKLLSIK